MTDENVKLNHPCSICGKSISLDGGGVIENEPLHYKCFEESIRQSERKRIIEAIEELNVLNVDELDELKKEIEK